jgi:dTMP kinase
MTGRLIIFEGIEGSGKSTQVERVYERIKRQEKVVTTKEPGGTARGKSIRDIILHGSESSGTSNFFLFEADRLEHIHEVLNPCLNKGWTVLCDRFSLSSLAYQPAEGVFTTDQTMYIDSLVRNTLTKAQIIQFLFELPVEEAFKRKGKDSLDSMERKSLGFHKMVAHNYDALAECLFPQTFRIDATQPPEVVEEEVLKLIQV